MVAVVSEFGERKEQVGSDMSQWRIEYVPGKPPVLPDQQPTGTSTVPAKSFHFSCQLNVHPDFVTV